jgi:hypothetical protein
MCLALLCGDLHRVITSCANAGCAKPRACESSGSAARGAMDATPKICSRL